MRTVQCRVVQSGPRKHRWHSGPALWRDWHWPLCWAVPEHLLLHVWLQLLQLQCWLAAMHSDAGTLWECLSLHVWCSSCIDTAPEDSCDRFVAEDCVYLGNVLVNQTSFQSASDCQKFLEEFGDIYRAQFFIHDNVPKHLCQLLDSDRRTCSSVAGPQEPAYEDCVEKNTV